MEESGKLGVESKMGLPKVELFRIIGFQKREMNQFSYIWTSLKFFLQCHMAKDYAVENGN